MKITTMFLAICGLFISCIGCNKTSEVIGGNQSVQEAGNQIAQDVMRQLDKNDDGRLDKSEMSAESLGEFAAVDSSGDGFVDQRELVAAMMEQIVQEVQGIMRQFDKNDDGRLDKSEVPAESLGGFAADDSSGDGFIDQRELVAVMMEARESIRVAAQQSSSKANMKNIMLALLAYEEIKRQFPGRAILDENGKPLLSWRVRMLPYLEAGDLHEKFHLDEPWDSPHNIKLLDQMPYEFKSPLSAAADPTKTNYVLPVGEGTVFPDFKPVKKPRSSSLTFALVEVDDAHAVPWTKPDDYDVKNLPSGLAGGDGKFNVATFGGATLSFPTNLNPDDLRAIFSADNDKYGSTKSRIFSERH